MTEQALGFVAIVIGAACLIVVSIIAYIEWRYFRWPTLFKHTQWRACRRL